MLNLTNDQGNAILFLKSHLSTYKSAKIKKFKITRVVVYMRDADTFILLLVKVYKLVRSLGGQFGSKF